jgi:hypothetical protein
MDTTTTTTTGDYFRQHATLLMATAIPGAWKRDDLGKMERPA